MKYAGRPASIRAPTAATTSASVSRATGTPQTQTGSLLWRDGGTPGPSALGGDDPLGDEGPGLGGTPNEAPRGARPAPREGAPAFARGGFPLIFFRGANRMRLV